MLDFSLKFYWKVSSLANLIILRQWLQVHAHNCHAYFKKQLKVMLIHFLKPKMLSSVSWSFIDVLFH